MIHKLNRKKYYISIEDVNVGDIVRILYDERHTERMKKFVDCISVVTEVIPAINSVRLHIDNGFYYWHISCIEQI